MKWRKWNNIIHRDLGYLCFGLTFIYAISGVAVNHIADWNPSYKIERVQTAIDPVVSLQLQGDKLVDEILNRVGETRKLKNSFQPDPTTIKIFLEENTITADIATGNITQEIVRNRTGLYEMNFLHLNHAKKLWTYFADIYAVALALLAITGLFVLRGKKGITGRGAWLTSAGIVVPIAFLFAYL